MNNCDANSFGCESMLTIFTSGAGRFVDRNFRGTITFGQFLACYANFLISHSMMQGKQFSANASPAANTNKLPKRALDTHNNAVRFSTEAHICLCCERFQCIISIKLALLGRGLASPVTSYTIVTFLSPSPPVNDLV